MKIMKLLSLLIFLSPCLIGCDNNFKASFINEPIKKVTVGDTINFMNYLDYDDNATVSLKYSTEKIKNQTYNSLYFQTSEVSMHNFEIIFSLKGKNKKLKCDIDVVPSAPSVTESTSSVFVNIGETITFTDLIDKSGVDALPFGYVNFAFKGVSYQSCYTSNYVKLNEENNSYQYSEILKEATSYTFLNYGKYIFDLDIYNSEGSVSTTIQVSVIKNEDTNPLNLLASGAIFAEGDNVVQLVRSDSYSSLSYLYYQEMISLQLKNEYTICLEFYGKNAPQIILNANKANGKKYAGTGYIISLEENSKNQLGIYGEERFNSVNLSPSRSSGNTFSRQSLKDNILYKWEVIFRLTLQKDNTYHLCIKSNLYKENILYRIYDWVSLEIANIEPAYFGFLGSSLDDITFKYFDLIKESVNNED